MLRTTRMHHCRYRAITSEKCRTASIPDILVIIAERTNKATRNFARRLSRDRWENDAGTSLTCVCPRPRDNVVFHARPRKQKCPPPYRSSREPTSTRRRFPTVSPRHVSAPNKYRSAESSFLNGTRFRGPTFALELRGEQRMPFKRDS